MPTPRAFKSRMKRNSSSISFGQRRGRLVHDEYARVVVGEGLGDLHHLLAGHGQRADDGGGADVDGKAGQKLRGHFILFALVEQYAVHRLAADEYVFRHRQILHQVQFLMDDGNAQRLRVARVVDLHGLAVEQDLARVHLVDACEHLHHRRFSGAVLAHQRVDFAAFQFKVAIVQRVNAWKVFLDPPHLQQDFTHAPRTSLSQTVTNA